MNKTPKPSGPMPAVEPETNAGNDSAAALLTQWWERQKVAFESWGGGAQPSGGAEQAAGLWRSIMEFWSTLGAVLPAQAGASEAAIDSLVAPAAGGGGLQGLVGRANQAPGFATLWDWDRKSLRSYGAWLALSDASTAHRQLLDQAWQDAQRRFLAEIAKPQSEGGPLVDSWRKGLDLWFATANQCLLERQRSDEFLHSQKCLLRTALDYRLALRELGEEFCEALQIPGRGEVDDLARSVHELRRELREAKRHESAPRTGPVARPAPRGGLSSPAKPDPLRTAAPQRSRANKA